MSALRALAKAQGPAVPLSAVLHAAQAAELLPAEPVTVDAPLVQVSTDSRWAEQMAALRWSMV